MSPEAPESEPVELHMEIDFFAASLGSNTRPGDFI